MSPSSSRTTAIPGIVGFSMPTGTQGRPTRFFNARWPLPESNDGVRSHCFSPGADVIWMA